MSVLPCFEKNLEKLMYKRVLNFLNKHKLLIDSRYKFRKKRSTHFAILEVVSKISKAVDNSEYTMGAFLELSKAFDTLDHNILLYKLEHYGFRGIALDWFRNYLSGRKQIVQFKSTSSDYLTIKCGAPQGSVLGPLLFLIYDNDIYKSSEILSFIFFGEDTNLFLSNQDLKTLNNTMNHKLEKVTLWLAASRLSLNVGKTDFMIFESRNKNVQHEVTVNTADQNIKEGNHIYISLASFSLPFPTPLFFSRTIHFRVFPTILAYLTAWNRLRFLFARLCLVSLVLRFLPVSPFDLVNYSLSDFRFVFVLDRLVSSPGSRHKVVIGLCATPML